MSVSRFAWVCRLVVVLVLVGVGRAEDKRKPAPKAAKADPPPARKVEDVADAPAEPVPAGQQYKQIFEQTFTRNLDQELSILARLTGLSEKQQKVVRQAAEPIISKIAEARSKEIGSGPFPYNGIERLPDEVSEMIFEKLSGVVTDDKLEAYRADVKVRRKYDREIGISGMLIYLDSVLALNLEQIQQVRNVVSKRFRPAWTTMSMNVIYGNMTSYPTGTPFDEIMPFLNDAQKAELESVKNADPGQMMGPGIIFGPPGETEAQEKKMVEAFKVQLTKAIALRVSNFEEHFELTAAQKKKLQLVAKGIHATLPRKRLAAMRRYRDAVENRAGNVVALDPADIQMVSQSAGMLLQGNPVWENRVLKVFQGRQRDEYSQVIQSRHDRHRQAFVAAMAVGMSQQLQLNGTQTIAFTKLLGESFPDEVGMRIDFEMFMRLNEVPKEKWIAAIGAKAWPVFKSQLDMAAQQYEIIKKARDEQATEGDEDASEGGEAELER